jgi:hypothetical protein
MSRSDTAPRAARPRKRTSMNCQRETEKAETCMADLRG